MPAYRYPFIDLAVHPLVRERFARGDAIAILSTELDEVLWVNGAAAQLFGYANIYDMMEQGVDDQPTVKRQIEAALSGLARSGRPQNFMIRVASGFKRQMMAASLEFLALPDGTRAVLMTGRHAGPLLAPGARAREIISGFEGTGTHVAVLDADCRVLAASRTFADIGLSETEIRRMIADVAGEADRLVKRMATARLGPMPAAIGRLADDPALHLLFAVETMADEAEDEGGVDATPATPESGAEPDRAEDRDAGPGGSEPAPGFDAERLREELSRRIQPGSGDEDVPLPFADARGLAMEPEDAGPQETDANEVIAAGDDADESGPDTMDEAAHGASDATADDLAHGLTEQSLPASAPEEPHAPAASNEADPTVAPEDAGFIFDPLAKPARFVWKIDREGAFSEVSPEFAAAVGPHAADIVGRTFPDLARVFNLDPDHVISDLLNRRDTWSGKTVFWPIQGTDLVTPVDLAALPTYTRDRRFDGFRGFGIVRTGETRRDPEALGLALVPGAASSWDAGSASPTSGDMTAQDDARPQDETPSVPNNAVAASRQDSADAPIPVGDDGPAADPFRGEKPVIHLVGTQMRRDSDKIINLQTRRTRPAESLSPVEQAAFREIGARLSGTPAGDEAAEEEAPGAGPETPPFGKRPAAADSGADSGPAGVRDIEVRFDSKPEAPPEAGDAETTREAEPAMAEAAAASPVSEPEAETQAEAKPAAVHAAPQPALLPSAFALPARQVMRSGLDAALIDAIPAAILVHSGDNLIHANAEFLSLTGYPSLQALSDQGGLEHLFDRPADGSDAADGQVMINRADGGAQGVTARLRSINWGDGQALLLALAPAGEPGSLSEARAAEAPAPLAATAAPAGQTDRADALEIETQELRSILETATDGVVILDNDGTIRSMNGSACALFNYDEAQTRGQPFAMLFAHESQRAVIDYVSGLAEHGVSSVLNDGREVIGREAGGGFLPLFMTIGRLSGSNGYCAVLRDITQWKRTEEELRTAKRAAETASSHKSDFLARVSHEIRTPLNAIIGFSEMMVEERFGPIGSPRYLEYANDIGNSGKHVLDIVNDLLDISKIEAGQVDMEFVAVSLNDHLAESVSLLQPMANSQRVIIRTSLSAAVPEVVADQRSVKQIALNLLSNAIRFTPSGGQIVVSTSYEASGSVVIRIRDTGIGMNRKELEQAMKPFGQVGPGPRQRGEGTGLGLPLTKAMVEANRAQFDIVSSPGEGTLVSVIFPPQRVLAD